MVKYIIDDPDMIRTQNGITMKYPIADSIDGIRKKAIVLLTEKKWSQAHIYKVTKNGGIYQGSVERTVAGDTPFCWKTKKATYDLYSSGRLGEVWGRRWGH